MVKVGQSLLEARDLSLRFCLAGLCCSSPLFSILDILAKLLDFGYQSLLLSLKDFLCAQLRSLRCLNFKTQLIMTFFKRLQLNRQFFTFSTLQLLFYVLDDFPYLNDSLGLRNLHRSHIKSFLKLALQAPQL